MRPGNNNALMACLSSCTGPMVFMLLAFVMAMGMPGIAFSGGPAMKPVPGDILSPRGNPTTRAKVELGKKLFFDRRLSGDGTMSCVTCHNPEAGFSDGLPISLSYPTTKNWRNSPTLINVAFKPNLFHDGRAASLEEQALFPMMSAFEMNQNLDYMEEELASVPGYVAGFEEAFGKAPITRHLVAKALAAFQRTLVSRGSPIDDYLKKGEAAKSFTRRMARGLEVFIGKGGCIRCHNGVNLSDGLFHNTGVPDDESLRSDPRVRATVRFVGKVAGYEDYKALDEDTGRYLVTKKRKDMKAFATPTLRDVSRTAPYMHNGMFGTLDEVIEFYDAGGGATNRAGLRPLGLSAAEKQDLKAFVLEALTGKEIIIKYPRLP